MLKEITIPFTNLVNRQLTQRLGKKTILRNTFFGEKSFYCSSTVEVFRTMRYGDEESSLGAFLFLLDKEDIVWDIGSSIGLYSIYASDIANEILSFEPDPNIHSRFKENINLNKLGNKISTFPYAIGAEDGMMQLNSDGINGMSPSLSNLERHSNSFDVEVKTIDSLIQEGLKTPTVLKIDIEGAEILALKGGKLLFQSENKPRLLFIEVHPNFLPSFNSSQEEIESILEDYSYRILSTIDRDNQVHIIAIPA